MGPGSGPCRTGLDGENGPVSCGGVRRWVALRDGDAGQCVCVCVCVCVCMELLEALCLSVLIPLRVIPSLLWTISPQHPAALPTTHALPSQSLCLCTSACM